MPDKPPTKVFWKDVFNGITYSFKNFIADIVVSLWFVLANLPVVQDAKTQIVIRNRRESLVGIFFNSIYFIS